MFGNNAGIGLLGPRGNTTSGNIKSCRTPILTVPYTCAKAVLPAYESSKKWFLLILHPLPGYWELPLEVTRPQRVIGVR